MSTTSSKSEDIDLPAEVEIQDNSHETEEELRALEEKEMGNNEEEEEMDDHNEQERLGAYPPFKTLCRLTIGPLCSQIVNSLYGLMNSFWISHTIGEKGMTVMSIVLVVDFINIAFAQYFNVCMSARVSFLFGAKMQKDASQVVVDILRFNLVAGVLIPCILLPSAKPLMRWYGANEEIASMCLDYLMPQLILCFLNYTYLSLCGLLQAMGKSVLYGACQLTSSILTMCVFDPLFLMGLHSGMWGASCATMISIFLPCMSLYIALFMGKFTVKPKFKQYFKKFNHHSWSALKVSLSQLISNLAASIPVLLLAKFISQSATNIGEYEPVMAAWNLQDRLYAFSICVCNALNQGFLPAGSYAYGCGRLNRLFHLGMYALILGTIWSLVVVILICSLPKQIASIWGKNEDFLMYAKRMLVYGFCTAFVNMGQYTITACLQAIKMVKLSIITSCLTLLIPLPVFSIILYYTNKNDPIRLVLSFVGHDVWSFFVVLIVALWKLRFICTAEPSGKGEIELENKILKNDEETEEVDPENVAIDIEDSSTKGSNEAAVQEV